jgi:hypothetical protein
MGRLDDAREAETKAQAESKARVQAMFEELRRPREKERRRREEEDRLSEEQGRQLSEDFLNEVRTRHIEPNDSVYVVTTKQEWVRRTDYTGKKSWDWSEEEIVSREESGRCFLIVCHHFDDKTRRSVETKHGIDPTTGQELVAKTELEELSAIKGWIRQKRPKTKIRRTSVVQRPLMDHDGLARAMVKFLDEPR